MGYTSLFKYYTTVAMSAFVSKKEVAVYDASAYSVEYCTGGFCMHSGGLVNLKIHD